MPVPCYPCVYVTIFLGINLFTSLAFAVYFSSL
uniref:Uncharacterized protein n=1 Tax=Rhizophora mucronata TaxID=61149 RepID=A0A2P2Q4Y7_RHIMU